MRAGPVQAESAIADDHDGERRADDADEGQRQQEAGDGLERVGDAHQDLVDQPAGKAGQRADDRADDEGCGGCGQSHGQRGARAMKQFGQHVAAETVGAERQRPVLKRRQQGRAGDGLRVAGEDERGDSAMASSAARMTAPATVSGVRKKRR